MQLDQMFRASKTHDAKPLTDGEIISALGMLIGRHCTASENVMNWVRGIELVAVQVNATKGHPQ